MNLTLTFATESEAREAFAKLADGSKVNQPLEQAFLDSLFGQLEGIIPRMEPSLVSG
jgi:PhnB protein